MHTFVGEDEVIKMNMELAVRNDFTMDDINALPEHIRAELIDGHIFYFAGANTIHQRIAGNLYVTLSTHIKQNQGACEVFFPPYSVFLDDENKNSLQPDVLVICDSAKIKEDGCHGAPDLVIEVVSKSTKSRDYGIKLQKYRTSGVKEYWVIDPTRETVLVNWFEDENLNYLYGFDEEIEFHLFPGLTVTLNKN